MRREEGGRRKGNEGGERVGGSEGVVTELPLY